MAWAWRRRPKTSPFVRRRSRRREPSLVIYRLGRGAIQRKNATSGVERHRRGFDGADWAFSGSGARSRRTAGGFVGRRSGSRRYEMERGRGPTGGDTRRPSTSNSSGVARSSLSHRSTNRRPIRRRTFYGTDAATVPGERTDRSSRCRRARRTRARTRSRNRDRSNRRRSTSWRRFARTDPASCSTDRHSTSHKRSRTSARTWERTWPRRRGHSNRCSGSSRRRAI